MLTKSIGASKRLKEQNLGILLDRKTRLTKTVLVTAAILLSACGGGSDPAPEPLPTPPPIPAPTPAPEPENLSISGVEDDELFMYDSQINVVANSADLTSASLSVNGVEVATDTESPFEFDSMSIAELAAIAKELGRHEITVKGVIDGKEQTSTVNIRVDGEYMATYAALNYVYENAPQAIGELLEIGGVQFTGAEGDWIDIDADADISGTEDDRLYTREKAAQTLNLSHQVSNGVYVVSLYFAEIWFDGTRGADGARIFDVMVEGNLLANDLDLYAEVGYLGAYVLKDGMVDVSDGNLNIDLIASVDNAKVNAYSIQRKLRAFEDEDSDSIVNIDDKCLGTPASSVSEVDDDGCVVPVDNGGSPVKIDGGKFIESDGLLVVEMESTDHPTGWAFETGREATGSGYLNMTGNQAAWAPQNISEIISVRIEITNPGRYQFAWRNLITAPNVPPSEHNDSYLKIIADKYYGQKDENIVCPKVIESGNQCVPSGRSLRGEAIDGYFKVWRSGRPIDSWNWDTNTSDNDGHTIYAEFDNAGEYKVIIANRSDFHAIDRFVLFKSGNDSGDLSKTQATDIANPESARGQ